MKPLHIAALTLTFSLGFVVAMLIAPQLQTPEPTHMHSEQYEVPEDMSVPNLELSVEEDPKSGWNLLLTVENFEFSAESASLDHEDGKGHAHLYINEKKITRLYDEWVYLPDDWLKKGENEIHVTLNTNDHLDYAVNGDPIEVSIFITK